MSFEEEEGEEC